MPSLVESISPLEIGLGVAVGALAAVLVGFGYYRPSPSVAVALALLVVVVAARGLQPFGDTTAYHLLQAAVFAGWGLTVIVAENANVIAVVFVFVGVAGVLHYARQATRQGAWTSVAG